ncbi:unnamed protein product [Calicophoron daubneyi]|uniref:Transmembrane protein n=1 Tax=Calicophoron daubneyi TaxID=300641 RepID=A0AAV2TMA0_CALDB
MVGTGTGTKPRRRPRKCILGIYHAGAVLLSIGILVAVIGAATSRIFHVYIYDHRKPAKFLQIRVPVGLFSQNAEVTWLSLEQNGLEHGLELTNTRWIIAQTATIVGILTAIAVLILHITISCCRAHHRWTTVVFEVCGLLAAITAILIGLSLAECEIEYIHDEGDPALTNLLASNGLLSRAEVLDASHPVATVLPTRSTEESAEEKTNVDGDFALQLTPPQMSFSLLIAADFLILLAFLAVLIYFVRVCEKAVQARKELRHAETSQI